MGCFGRAGRASRQGTFRGLPLLLARGHSEQGDFRLFATALRCRPRATLSRVQYLRRQHLADVTEIFRQASAAPGSGPVLALHCQDSYAETLRRARRLAALLRSRKPGLAGNSQRAPTWGRQRPCQAHASTALTQRAGHAAHAEPLPRATLGTMPDRLLAGIIAWTAGWPSQEARDWQARVLSGHLHRCHLQVGAGAAAQGRGCGSGQALSAVVRGVGRGGGASWQAVCGTACRRHVHAVCHMVRPGLRA